MSTPREAIVDDEGHGEGAGGDVARVVGDQAVIDLDQERVDEPDRDSVLGNDFPSFALQVGAS